MVVIRSSRVRPGAKVQPLKVSVSSCCLAQVNSTPCTSVTVKFNTVLEGAAWRGAVLTLPAGAALRGDVEPVEAAICAAEKAMTTARARSVAALFIITFLLACARIPAAVEVSAECAILNTMCCPGTWTAFDFAPDMRLLSEQNCTQQWHKHRQYAIENERDIALVRVRDWRKIKLMEVVSYKLDNDPLNLAF